MFFLMSIHIFNIRISAPPPPVPIARQVSSLSPRACASVITYNADHATWIFPMLQKRHGWLRSIEEGHKMTWINPSGWKQQYVYFFSLNVGIITENYGANVSN